MTQDRPGRDTQGEAAGSFEERLVAARTRQGMDPEPPVAGKEAPVWGVGLRVGTELVAALVVAVAIGWGLDRWLGTTPWLMGLFVVLGGAAGVANVWRLMMPVRRPPGTPPA